MRVKINRNLCPAHLAFCERCLGQFLKYPMGYERRCFEEIEDDGKEDLLVGGGGRDWYLDFAEEDRILGFNRSSRFGDRKN